MKFDVEENIEEKKLEKKPAFNAFKSAESAIKVVFRLDYGSLREAAYKKV